MPNALSVPNQEPVTIQGGLMEPNAMEPSSEKPGVPSYVNTKAMSATAVINTPCEDREGDIIIPSGVILSQYETNPVVLWEHGLDGISKPIAKCVDPNGQLAVNVTDEQITATSYFTHLDRESSQVFHLIAAGIVRATSVRAMPVKSQPRRAESGIMGNLIEEWYLVEWSWGALGVNPEAIAKTLARGTIDGDRITEPLMKSLKKIAPEPVNFFKGITLPGGKAVADENTTDKPEDDVSKVDTPTEDDPKKTEPVDTTDPQNQPDQETDKMDDAMMEEDDPNIPMGAKVLRALYGDLGQMRAMVKAAVAPLEQPDVKQAVTELMDVLSGGMESLSGAYSTAYPDMDALAEADPDMDEEAEKTAKKSLGAWMCMPGNKTRLAGIRASLKAIADKKTLNPQQQRRAIADVYRRLQTIERQAMACQPVNYEKKFNDLEQKFNDLTAALEEVLPAN